jgi:hypothetical protein
MNNNKESLPLSIYDTPRYSEFVVVFLAGKEKKKSA